VAPSCERDLGPSAQSGVNDEDDFTLAHGGLEWIARRLSRGVRHREVSRMPRSIRLRKNPVQYTAAVPRSVGGAVQRQGFWTPSIGWFHTVALAVKVDVARRRHGGDPAGRLVPRLTIRPSLLTLAALAPLTAGSGVGNRLSAINDGPGGATSAPPVINHKERHTMTTTTTTTVAGNLTRE